MLVKIGRRIQPPESTPVILNSTVAQCGQAFKTKNVRQPQNSPSLKFVKASKQCGPGRTRNVMCPPGVGLGACYGPRPLKSTRRHGHFLNSTCDIGLGNT